MPRVLLLTLALLLGACAARTPLPPATPALAAPLPLSLHVQRQAPAATQDWLLVVQAEDAALRWSLFDPLGVPLARQRLERGHWQSDGLLPPNAQARELFAALLFALTDAGALPEAYPDGGWQLHGASRRLQPNWRIDYRAPLDFTLNDGADLSYQVRPLPGQEQR